MMNRVEFLAGRRWAQDIVMSSASLLKLEGGHVKVLEMLKRGTIQKPSDYAGGVSEIITIVEDAVHVQALGVKA